MLINSKKARVKAVKSDMPNLSSDIEIVDFVTVRKHKNTSQEQYSLVYRLMCDQSLCPKKVMMVNILHFNKGAIEHESTQNKMDKTFTMIRKQLKDMQEYMNTLTVFCESHSSEYIED